ncbi:MAG: hypothetical protein LBQ21_07530 [Clostridiales Family XIII bacterium]|nr:hypothetical protein [Clostridiales Family XIII bacterium]
MTIDKKYPGPPMTLLEMEDVVRALCFAAGRSCGRERKMYAELRSAFCGHIERIGMAEKDELK